MIIVAGWNESFDKLAESLTKFKRRNPHGNEYY